MKSPFPRSIKGKFHVLSAHVRQLHLTTHLLSGSEPLYDIYFVDQLSTCIPFLRFLAKKRVVFYCHFPDKLLANGEFVEGEAGRWKAGILKGLYRLPMDFLEEWTTRTPHITLSRVLQSKSCPSDPRQARPMSFSPTHCLLYKYSRRTFPA